MDEWRRLPRRVIDEVMMNRWIRHLVSLVACLALVVSAQGQEAGGGTKPLRIRILSYNIHHAEGVDGKLDLGRIARVILSVKPDLVALQEVDQGVGRTKGVDQPGELGKLTEMQVAFGGNIKLQGGAYGNAILSRWPVGRHENHLLPLIEPGERRGVLEAEVAVPGRKAPLRLLATHLDHRSAKDRLASAKFINELMEKRGGDALLAGDMNAVPGSDPIKEIQSKWTSANSKPLPTIPVENPTRQIDFIFFRPAGQWRVVEVQVLDEAVASDHRGILAVLEWGRE